MYENIAWALFFELQEIVVYDGNIINGSTDVLYIAYTDLVYTTMVHHVHEVYNN